MHGMWGVLLALLVAGAQAAVTDVTLDNGMRVIVQEDHRPVGLHQVSALEIAGHRLRIAPIEAIDGTPVVDLKPVWPQRGTKE